jgi:hypothetical protein
MDDNENYWPDRFWAYAPTLSEVDTGEFLGTAWSHEELRKIFGEDIAVWDCKVRDWV